MGTELRESEKFRPLQVIGMTCAHTPTCWLHVSRCLLSPCGVVWVWYECEGVREGGWMTWAVSGAADN